MFCNNCGTELEDGITFCPNCGTKVSIDNAGTDDDDKTVILSEEDDRGQNAAWQSGIGAAELQAAKVEQIATPNTGGERVETVEISPTGVVGTGTAVVVSSEVEQKRFCPNCGTEIGINNLFCQQCGMFFGNAAEKMGSGNVAAKTHKGGGVWKIAAIAVVLLAVVGSGIVFAPRLFGGSGTSDWEQDFVLYIKDNELTMAQKNKYEPLVIGDRMFDDKDDITNHYYYACSLVACSPDHKYVYYPQKADANGCDLFRKQLGSKKAEAVKIDSQVTEYSVIDNDRLVYIKDSTNRKMYLYYNGESEKIASNVWGMRVSADGKYILWQVDDKLYVQDTKLKSDKMKLDSDVSGIYGVSDDFGIIVYRKDDNLYVMKGMEEKEKIASHIYDAYVYDINRSLKIYYMKKRGEESLSYYDLIEDDCLAQDGQMVEPRIEDYQRITYKDSFWGVQEKVEVSDSYYEELDKYQQKLDRDYLRADLESYMMEMLEWEFYYYDDAAGDSNKVLTALIQSGETAYGNVGTDTALMYVYNTDQEQGKGIKLSEVENMDYSEIQQQVNEKISESRQLWYIEDGEIHEIADFECDSGYVGVWANEEEHMLYLSFSTRPGCNEIYSFDYGRNDASLELISDEVSGVVSFNANDIGEICYVNVDGELYYGDTQIDEDVQPSFAFGTETGDVIYWTDLDEGEGALREGTLKVYRDGRVTEIADDAVVSYSPAGFCYVFDSDKIAFLADYNFKKSRGDLNVFDGKTIKKIDSDVTGIIY